MALSILSEFTSNLNTHHWIAAKQVLEYLKKTSAYILKLMQRGYDTVSFSNDE
jgi:hypothetical protein